MPPRTAGKGGNYKNLNLPFESLLLSQAREVRERMSKGVEDFVYTILTKVFNAEGTAESGQGGDPAGRFLRSGTQRQDELKIRPNGPGKRSLPGPKP